MEYFSSRYKLGCTATLQTANDLWKCIPKIIGDIIYELKKSEDKQKFIGYYEGKPIIEVNASDFQVPVEIKLITTQYNVLDKDVFDRNSKIVFSRLISDIALDYDRNKLILEIIKKLNGYTIVISDRVDQLHYLQEHTKSSICIDGKTNKKLREQLVNDFKKGDYKVLFASYQLVAEGLDVPMLENLIMATPVKDSRLVVQSIGRCQRPYNGKKIANIYDLVDDVSILDKFVRERKKVYKNEGWEII